MGAPAGPTGCNAPSQKAENQNSDASSQRGVQISAGYGHFWSHLHFEGGTEPTLTQQTVVGQLSYFFSDRIHLTLGGGGVLSGNLKGDGHNLDVGPGFLLSLRLAWQVLQEKGARPFLSLSIAFSYSRSKFDGTDTYGGHIWGTDARFALTVGYTFFEFWRVYLSPRVFGGPVFIDDGTDRIQGRDRYFVQAGMGMGFLLPKGFTIYIDGSPAGEQALSAGLAFYLTIDD